MLKINNGELLVDGHISYFWMQINFWRAFLAIYFSAMSILCVLSLSNSMGFLTNIQLETKIEDIIDRPMDDTIDIFSKIKQPIYQKALAFNKYHKKRSIMDKKLC